MILIKIFLEFFKIGFFTFGGGYAMIPLIEKETVNKYHWLTMEPVYKRRCLWAVLKKDLVFCNEKSEIIKVFPYGSEEQ